MPAKFWDNPGLIILENLQNFKKKGLRIINFLPDTAPLRYKYIHKNSKILKLPDYIALQNTLLITDVFNEELPKPLNEHFKKRND